MCDDSTIKKYVIILLSDAILDKSKETKQIIYRCNEYLYSICRPFKKVYKGFFLLILGFALRKIEFSME